MGLGILGKVVEGVSGFFTAKQRRKAAAESGKRKIEAAVLDAKNSLDLSDAEWEVQKTVSENDSWKDEFVTVIITSPIWLILMGAILAAFGLGDEVLVGTVNGLDALSNLGVDMGFLMESVVLAAVSLKVWRKV